MFLRALAPISLEHYRSEILHLNTLIIPITIPRPLLILLVFFVLFVFLFVSLAASAVSSAVVIFDGDIDTAHQRRSSSVLQWWQHVLHGLSLLHLLLPLLPFLLLPFQSRLFHLLPLLLLVRLAFQPFLFVFIRRLRVHILLLLLTSLFLGLLALFLLKGALLVLSRRVLHGLLPNLGHLLEQFRLSFNGLLLALLGNDKVLATVIFILGFLGKLVLDNLSCLFL